MYLGRPAFIRFRKLLGQTFRNVTQHIGYSKTIQQFMMMMMMMIWVLGHSNSDTAVHTAIPVHAVLNWKPCTAKSKAV